MNTWNQAMESTCCNSPSQKKEFCCAVEKILKKIIDMIKINQVYQTTPQQYFQAFYPQPTVVYPWNSMKQYTNSYIPIEV
ncbi:alpha-S2-casein-like A [Dipodomys merriami]|uniref:alpha-S2-casein-like A n=1 Tax=Dipodomys merriami TaxID=94247 RepID=UPI003855901C